MLDLLLPGLGELRMIGHVQGASATVDPQGSGVEARVAVAFQRWTTVVLNSILGVGIEGVERLV